MTGVCAINLTHTYIAWHHIHTPWLYIHTVCTHMHAHNVTINRSSTAPVWYRLKPVLSWTSLPHAEVRHLHTQLFMDLLVLDRVCLQNTQLGKCHSLYCITWPLATECGMCIHVYEAAIAQTLRLWYHIGYHLLAFLFVVIITLHLWVNCAPRNSNVLYLQLWPKGIPAPTSIILPAWDQMHENIVLAWDENILLAWDKYVVASSYCIPPA